jgi:hypothetical protein
LRWSHSVFVRRANQNNEGSNWRHMGALSEMEHQNAGLATALRELYDILESHAPLWYTREHHKRAESALRRGGKASADTFIELCALLEEYAPRWYRKEHYERARSILKLLER